MRKVDEKLDAFLEEFGGFWRVYVWRAGDLEGCGKNLARIWQNLALGNLEHAMLPALGRGRRILKREALCRQPPLNWREDIGRWCLLVGLRFRGS